MKLINCQSGQKFFTVKYLFRAAYINALRLL